MESNSPACIQQDPELFFPFGEQKARPARYDIPYIEAARAICRACDIRIECLELAIKNGEEYGIWGGLTSPERRAIQRERANHAKRAV